jgi:hypothetical protein
MCGPPGGGGGIPGILVGPPGMAWWRGVAPGCLTIGVACGFCGGWGGGGGAAAAAAAAASC